MSIRIDVIPNQYGTKAVLLRRTWCEGRRVRHKTVVNLSDLDPAVVDGFRAVLRGGVVLDDPRKAFVIRRALPHGHAAAVLGTMRRLGFRRLIGREANRRKMEKHFEIAVTDDGVSWSRREERVAEEARLDGIYVIRTSLDSASLGAEAAVEAYKSLASVERAFLTMKTSRLRIRPVHVYSEDHVRAHVFLCMLAYHVEWHMRQRLASILFEDDDREGARAQRNSPVEKAEVSKSAKAKADTKRTPDGLPVHSFTTLLSDLGTLMLNHASLPGQPDSRFLLASEPTELQARAFELLGMDPDRDAYISVTD